MSRKPASVSAAERAAEARQLADQLDAYVARHGLASWRVGNYLFKGARNGISQLRRRKSPTERVLARVRDFLAEPPPPGLHRRPLGGKRQRRDCSTGAWLADKVDALLTEHGLYRTRVSLHVFNSPHTLTRLRERKPQPRTIAKIEALLANPDIAALREPVARKIQPDPEPIVIKPTPIPPRRPLTFEEQLQRVLSGQARVVRKITIPTREHGFSAVGCAAAMVCEG